MWGPRLNRVFIAQRLLVERFCKNTLYILDVLYIPSEGSIQLEHSVCLSAMPVALNVRECYFRALNQGEGPVAIKESYPVTLK